MLRSHERKSDENGTENTQMKSKQERPANAKAARLRDKDVNRGYLTAGSLKAGEKDQGLQKPSITVYNEKTVLEENRVIPTKRVLGRRTTSPVSKRVAKEKQVEYAPPKEEEIPWAPGFDLDFSVYDDNADADAYQDVEQGSFPATLREFELECIEEQEVEEAESLPELPADDFSPTIAPLTAAVPESASLSADVPHPTTTEYAPPKEKELSDDVSSVKIDIADFTNIADESAYDLAEFFEETIEFPAFDDEDGFFEVPPIDDDALEFHLFPFVCLADDEEEPEKDFAFQIPFDDYLFAC